MRIRTRIAIALVAVVSVMLIGFTLLVYVWLRNAEHKAFNRRLSERGHNTAVLLEEVKEVDSTLLRVIDRSTLNPRRNEYVKILDPTGRKVYANLDRQDAMPDMALIQHIREEQEFRFEEGGLDAIGLHYMSPAGERYIVAYAFDDARAGFLANLRTIMAWGSIIILLITSLTAYFFSARALRPLFRLNNQVREVNDRSLAHVTRVQDPGSKDEIGELANSFNDMLFRLQDAFDQQKQFVRYASHELRTPLAAATSQIDLALQQDRSTEEYKALLVSLQEDHDRLSRLVGQLLLLFRAERIQEQQLEPVDMLDIVDNAIEGTRLEYPGTTIELDFARMPEYPEELTISGNAALLLSAVQNLVSNACKYGAGGKVSVHIDPQPKTLFISIVNGGALIPAEERDKIFQPFYRSSNHGDKSGFGLGLLLAKKIALLHDGDLTYAPAGNLNRFMLALPKKA